MGQLSFQWPLKASFAPEDFIPSAANALALRTVSNWPDGQAGAMLLHGPESSGKTHLASCWTARTHARRIDSASLSQGHAQEWWGGASYALLEDIHAVRREEGLFHLLRHAEAHGLYLLLTSRLPARGLGFTLPDLRSRLLALPAAGIEAPDEALLKAYLFKSLSDRQLRSSEDAVDYLAKRMERSFAAASALADRLEAAALASGRNITVPLARTILS